MIFSWSWSVVLGAKGHAARLREKLAQAVAEEAFEKAAQLRDRIRGLEGK